MNKTTRKKIHQAFKNAVPFLHVGRGHRWPTQYICTAVTYGAEFDGACLAREIIQGRIRPCRTVTEWLEMQGIDTVNFQKVQTYRHAWLQSLIKEFSV